MFFFKTYTACTIWSEIAMRKGSFSTTCNGDCSTLQTSKPNHPTTYTYINTHTNNSQSMHACIHSFIHSFNPPYSLYHSFTRTNQALPLQFITIYNHPSINHQPCIARTTEYGIRTCTHDITMARTQWNGMHLHAYRLPTTTLQRYIHTCMHREDDFLSPTECADEHLRWWWWWWYWPQSRYSS